MSPRYAIVAALALLGLRAFGQITSIPAAAGGSPGSGVTGLSVNGDGTVTSAVAVTWANCSTPTFNAGGTTTVNWALSNCAVVTASGGNTTIAFSNPHGAGQYSLALINDGTARVWTMPAAALNAATPAIASTGTYQSFQYDGSTNYQGLSATSTETPSILRGSLRAAPGTPTTGAAAWWDSTSLKFSSIDANGIVSTTKTNATVALGSSDSLNCTTLTSEQAFATLATVPANYLTAGVGGRIEFGTSWTTGSTTPQSLTIKMRLGSGTSGTTVYSSVVGFAPGVSYTGVAQSGAFAIQGTAAAGASVNVFTAPLGMPPNMGSNARSVTAQPVAWATNANNAMQITMTCAGTGTGVNGTAVTLDWVRWSPLL